MHRRLGDGELYFVNNRQDRAESLEASFRVCGPRGRDSGTPIAGGSSRPAYRIVGGRTIVPLEARSLGRRVRRVPRAGEVRGPRAAGEDAGSGGDALPGPGRWASSPVAARRRAPASSRLASWSDSADRGIRHFSGTGTYTRTLDVPAAWLADGAELWLDLGDVRDLAEVSVNGRPLGVLWKAPFRVNVTAAVHAGANELTIAVTNLWPNRLIGDAQPDAVAKYRLHGADVLQGRRRAAASRAARSGARAERAVRLPPREVNHMGNPGHGWKNTILAGLANYIDAGSIVAGSAALALWVEQYHLSQSFVGLIGAFSANAISAGIGALIGGRLCDRIGRKKIYQYDMLFYAFGMLWLVFAMQPWMIVAGFVHGRPGRGRGHSRLLVADRGDGAGRCARPAQRRRAGAVVPGAGGRAADVAGARAAGRAGRAHRVRAPGSRRPRAHRAARAHARIERCGSRPGPGSGSARRPSGSATASMRALLTPRHLKAMVFLVAMYGLWNLWAGTNGFFFPYILRTVGSQTQAASVALQAAGIHRQHALHRLRVHAARRPGQPEAAVRASRR